MLLEHKEVRWALAAMEARSTVLKPHFGAFHEWGR